MMRIGLAAALLLSSPALHAAESAQRRIAALIAQADALKAGGDSVAALARNRDALALADADPGVRGENVYVALAALAPHLPDTDFAGQFAVYERLATVAATARGPDSFAGLEPLVSRNMLAFALRKPGATLAAATDAIERALPLAQSERDRTRIAGLAMAAAQFQDATGQNAAAVALVAKVEPFYATPPATRQLDYGRGLTTLAKIHARWLDWPGAIALADRAIAAKAAYEGARNFELSEPLQVRGHAYAGLARWADAERDYREAVTLTDVQPEVSLKTPPLFSLARFYLDTGRDGLAAPVLTRVAELAAKGPAGSNTRMLALLDLYNVATRRGEDAAALGYAIAARADADARGFGASANYVAILIAVANASLRAKDLPTATAAVAAAEALLPKAVSANSSRYADVLLASGALADARGDAAGAAREIRAALVRWAQSPGGDPGQIAGAHAKLARQLGVLGDRPAAWREGRTGATQATRIIADRAARGSSDLLDGQNADVFEIAVDAAWANRRGR